MSDDAMFPSGCCGEIPWLEQDFLIDRYNASSGGAQVDHVVVMESCVGTPPEKLLQSNRWMLQQLGSSEKLLSVIGKLDVTQEPAGLIEQLDELDDPAFAGIRIGREVFESNREPHFENLKPRVLENLAEISHRGLMIDAAGIPIPIIAVIARALSKLDIVLDHWAGKPYTLDVEAGWREAIRTIADLENVYVKVSDTHRLSMAVMGASWPNQFAAVTRAERYHVALSALWESCGEDRLIFGTNWPVSEFGGLNGDSIELQISIVEAFLLGKSAQARNKVMHDNAMRIYQPRPR